MSFLYIFLLFRLSIAENTIPYIINDNSIDIDMLIYGDLTNMEYLFLPDSNEDTGKYNISAEIGDELPRNKSRLSFVPERVWDDLTELKGSPGKDLVEFNELTHITKNTTRRWYYYVDWEDYYHFYHMQPRTLEPEKKEKLLKINIQLLIHARYFIKKAMQKKEPIRMDKRYKMGYLFNRLRRIQYETLKLISIAKEQERSHYRELRNLIRMYEKVVHYDVDLNDLIMVIRALELEKLVQYPIPELIDRKVSYE